MRVLVTGAAGGLGRYVVRELRRRPDVVVLAPDHAAYSDIFTTTALPANSADATWL